MSNDSTEGWARVLRLAAWRKSSFSAGGECVSVAEIGREIALRNSNAPEAGTLLVGRGALSGWVAGVKAGQFDDLA